MKKHSLEETCMFPRRVLLTSNVKKIAYRREVSEKMSTGTLVPAAMFSANRSEVEKSVTRLLYRRRRVVCKLNKH